MDAILSSLPLQLGLAVLVIILANVLIALLPLVGGRDDSFFSRN